MKKNTRLFYNDGKSLDFWKTLPCETGYELFLACLEYRYGGPIPERLQGDPIAKALFIQLKEKIDYNEAKWANDGRRKTSAENGKKAHKQKEEQEEPVIKQEEVKVEESPAPTKDDEFWIDNFFYDPAMDFSTLLTNQDYFIQRKKDDLDLLYKRLGGRYSPRQLIQMLQERYLQRNNKENVVESWI